MLAVLVLLLGAALPVESNRHKIRMELITMLDCTASNEQLLKFIKFLNELVDLFDLGPTRTRLGPVFVSKNSDYQTGFLTDRNDYEVALSRRRFNNGSEMVLWKGLQAMLNMIKSYARPDAALVVLLMTGSTPHQIDNTATELYEGPILAKEMMNKHIKFFILYQPTADNSDESKQNKDKTRKYFSMLTNHEDRVLEYDRGRDLDRAILWQLADKIIDLLCSRESVCSFLNEKLQCVYDTIRRSSHVEDGCDQLRDTEANQRDCETEMCARACEQFWPWKPQSTCYCDTGRVRVGTPPYGHLFMFCPKSANCSDACVRRPTKFWWNSTTPASTSTQSPTTTIRVAPWTWKQLPQWLVYTVVGSMIFLAVMAGLTFWMIFARRRRHHRLLIAAAARRQSDYSGRYRRSDRRSDRRDDRRSSGRRISDRPSDRRSDRRSEQRQNSSSPKSAVCRTPRRVASPTPQKSLSRK